MLIKLDGRQNTYLEKELKIIDYLSQQTQQNNLSKFIVNYYGYYKINNQYFIISELCKQGDLFTHLYQYFQYYTNEIKLEFLVEIISGIETLHSLQIVHRDLKPDNILIAQDYQTGNYYLKITDFGISSLKNISMTSQVGTIVYMAPEIIKNEKYDNKVDIWSFGCIAYEIMTNKEYFQYKTDVQTARDIKAFKEYKRIDSGFDDIEDILAKCIHPNPQSRPTASEIKRDLLEIQKKYYQFQNNQKDIYSSQGLNHVEQDDISQQYQKKITQQKNTVLSKQTPSKLFTKIQEIISTHQQSIQNVSNNNSMQMDNNDSRQFNKNISKQQLNNNNNQIIQSASNTQQTYQDQTHVNELQLHQQVKLFNASKIPNDKDKITNRGKNSTYQLENKQQELNNSSNTYNEVKQLNPQQIQEFIIKKRSTISYSQNISKDSNYNHLNQLNKNGIITLIYAIIILFIIIYVCLNLPFFSIFKNQPKNINQQPKDYLASSLSGSDNKFDKYD